MSGGPIFFAVVILGATPVLLICALAVRYAGKARVLNLVDYDGIADPAAVNRNIGNRLLLLPLGSLLVGGISLAFPAVAGMLGAVFVALFFGCVGSVVWTAANLPR